MEGRKKKHTKNNYNSKSKEERKKEVSRIAKLLDINKDVEVETIVPDAINDPPSLLPVSSSSYLYSKFSSTYFLSWL